MGHFGCVGRKGEVEERGLVGVGGRVGYCEQESGWYMLRIGQHSQASPPKNGCHTRF